MYLLAGAARLFFEFLTRSKRDVTRGRVLHLQQPIPQYTAARDYSTLGSNRLFNRFLHFPYLAVLSDTLFPLAHFNLIPNSMEEIFDKLKVGLNVDIQRTDGEMFLAGYSLKAYLKETFCVIDYFLNNTNLFSPFYFMILNIFLSIKSWLLMLCDFYYPRSYSLCCCVRR